VCDVSLTLKALPATLIMRRLIGDRHTLALIRNAGVGPTV
jgi:hypothetical protein